MNDLFVKARFLLHGHQAPENSRFKGKVTTRSVFGEKGWFEYTSRDDANIKRLDDIDYHHNFFEYTSREGANSNSKPQNTNEITYTNYGLLTEEQEKKFVEEGKQYFKNKNDIVWDTVISFKDYEYTKQRNLNSIEDYGSMMSKVLPAFFKEIHLENDNMMWWMNYHTDKDHPHIHLSFFEKEHTKSRGKLTKQQIEELKMLINKELLSRKLEYTSSKELYGNLLRQKDFYKNILMDDAKKLDLKLFQKVEELFQKLPEKGRLQYNSIHIKPFRSELDEIVNEMIQSTQLQESYQNFIARLEEIESFGEEMEDGNLGHIKEVEIRKLHINLANLLLSCKKDFKFSEQTIVEDVEADTQKGEVIFDQGRKIFKLNPKNFLKQNATFKHNLFCKSKGSISKKKKELEEELEKYLNQHKTLGGELSV